MDYLQKLRQPVENLQNRMQLIQNNLLEIKSLMSTWAKQPLFERKDGKKDTVLCLEERHDRITKRYSDIEAGASKIYDLLEENVKHFGINQENDGKLWVNYVCSVDDIVYENILMAVGVSLSYLAENMDPANNFAPLFESRLELLDPNLIFVPSLSPDDPQGFISLLKSLIADIIQMAALIKRLKPNSSRTYIEEISVHLDIEEMRNEILEGVDTVCHEAAEYCRNFERYSYLWLEEREPCMELFLQYGRVLDQDELELVFNNDPTQPKPSAPTIDAFREQIDNYESLFQEIEQINSFQAFNAWFQVDVRPFRQSLLNIVRKWGNMFKEHLVNRVTSNLCDLSSFIRQADEGLLQTVKEGDYEGLVNIMAYLLNVKERGTSTDEMFEPMQETIALLKYYDMDIPEEVNVLLQELPEQWANTKKIALTVKQQVAPLQAAEVVGIRNRIQQFDSHITFFREVFKSYGFFKYESQDPYGLLNRIHMDISRLENEMKDIQESGSLFEVTIPEFKFLRQCRKELRMLKQLWDYVYIVQTCIQDWKKTPWRKVDVENMDIECKKFAKDIRLLDKEMRPWDTFITLEGTVKNMLTSLRAVGELQNPAIRERHWNQLMKSTKVFIKMHILV